MGLGRGGGGGGVFQVPLSWWFELEGWGIEPLALVENGEPPKKPPNQQSIGQPLTLLLREMQGLRNGVTPFKSV